MVELVFEGENISLRRLNGILRDKMRYEMLDCVCLLGKGLELRLMVRLIYGSFVN